MRDGESPEFLWLLSEVSELGGDAILHHLVVLGLDRGNEKGQK